MSHTSSVGDTSGPTTRPQAEKNSQELQEENMGTSLLEYFSANLIEKHLQILSESDTANLRLQKTRTAANLVADQLAAEDSNCKVCQQSSLPFKPQCIQCYQCYTKINRNQTYHSYINCGIRATLCHSCFTKSGDTIQLQSSLLRKDDMKKKQNDAMPGETWVQCDSCQEWVHQICGLFNEGRNDGKRVFSCPQCLLTGLRNGKRTLPESRPQAMLTAKDLPRCRLSDVLEERLNDAIKKERNARANAMNVDPSTLETVSGLTVRIVSNVEKTHEVKPKFAETFCREQEGKSYSNIFKYKQKVILLFQEVDGVDMCLFCIYVQEYGDDCPAPNNRTVYLSYLDSVNYFSPKDMKAHGLDVRFRTYIYHEILIGYLSDAKSRGFCSMYIWSCPPSAGDDYIMHCHPGEQRPPSSKKLRKWYHNMLQRAKDENIVVYVSNLFDTFFHDGRDHMLERPSITDLPYLDGDYWPGEAETMLAKYEETTVASNSARNRGRGIGKDKRIRLPDDAGPGELLLARLGVALRKMKADFLVAHMYESCSHCREYMNGTKRYYNPNLPEKVKIDIDKAVDGDNPKGESSRSVQLLRYQLCEKCYARENGKAADGAVPIDLPIGITLKDLIAELCPEIPKNNDPDPIMSNEFDTRLQFLSLCQRNHYQFDSLRRARHSSMMVLYHLHNPGEPALSVNCNLCEEDVSPGQGYRCQRCPDFNLCRTCYENPEIRHEHDLSMILTKENKKHHERALKETLDMLIHALFECNQPECDKPKCMGIKRLYKHAYGCTTKLIGGCQHCKKMWAIFNAHSKICAEYNCRVPGCRRLRELRRQDAAHYEELRRRAYREMLKKQESLQAQTSQSHF